MLLWVLLPTAAVNYTSCSCVDPQPLPNQHFPPKYGLAALIVRAAWINTIPLHSLLLCTVSPPSYTDPPERPSDLSCFFLAGLNQGRAKYLLIHQDEVFHDPGLYSPLQPSVSPPSRDPLYVWPQPAMLTEVLQSLSTWHRTLQQQAAIAVLTHARGTFTAAIIHIRWDPSDHRKENK